MDSHKETPKDKDVCLIIQTSQGEWKTLFPKTTKVSEVITAVKQHFNFAETGKYEMRLESNPKETLKPERTLVSYGLSEVCQKVVFTDMGNAA